MNSIDDYQSWHEIKEREWEARCIQCGACCGALEDPCEHLEKLSSGQYACRVYDTRFGFHKTVSGHELRCVPVRSKLGTYWPGDERCGYKK